MRFDTIVWREHGKSKELLRARLLKYLLLSVRFLSKNGLGIISIPFTWIFRSFLRAVIIRGRVFFLGNTVKFNKIKLNQRENCMFLVKSKYSRIPILFFFNWNTFTLWIILRMYLVTSWLNLVTLQMLFGALSHNICNMYTTQPLGLIEEWKTKAG